MSKFACEYTSTKREKLGCHRFFFFFILFFIFIFDIIMIPDSRITRGLIYSFAVLQTSIAPFAFFYYVYYLATEEKLFTIHPSIHYWLGCELLFYVFFHITRNRMQRLLPSVAPSAKERSDLYYLCVSNIEDPQPWLSEWFILPNGEHPKFEEIYRENVAEW